MHNAPGRLTFRQRRAGPFPSLPPEPSLSRTLRQLFARLPAALQPRAIAPGHVTHRLCGHTMDPSEDTDCTVCSVKLQLVWPHTRESTADLSHELHAQVRFLAKERRVFEQYRKLNPDLVDAKFTTAAAQLVRHASAAAEAARKLESSRAAALANADTDTKVGFFIAFLLQLPVADRRRAFASISEAIEKPDIAIAELMEAVGVRYDGAGVLPAEHTPHALGPGSAP